jgi:hypothetical protein
MRLKYLYLHITFVKCKYDGEFIYPKKKIPSPIIFFSLNSDFDYPVF